MCDHKLLVPNTGQRCILQGTLGDEQWGSAMPVQLGYFIVGSLLTNPGGENFTYPTHGNNPPSPQKFGVFIGVAAVE